MKPFEKCPVCGGDLEIKYVEKLLRGGGNTVSMKVIAEVCFHCGERLYAEDVVKSFEQIRGTLRKQEFSHLGTLGQSFTVEKNWPNKAIQPAASLWVKRWADGNDTIVFDKGGHNEISL